ncbi:MAG: serine/threonine protein kinase [Cyanobacteria bacterium SZAS-4]|nr:serine/threonine protein kinase [Cyanobacteria bacterium SZAS-4]
MQAKEPKKVHVKLDCDICGKPFKAKNRGSLTGWIFGEESVPGPKDADKFCSCGEEDTHKPFGNVKLVETETAAIAATPATPAPPKKPELPADANVGRKIADRYEIRGVIGEGGMSTVYRVHDSVLDKTLALKMLRKEFILNETSIKRFEQEAKAVRSLTHPHLATVYDHGRSEDGSPYLVMDYIEGDSLAELLKKEIFLDVPRALAISLQICTAVSYAHEHGVIHRDLKPENIILTNAGADFDFVKLIDFGIAKFDSENGLSTQRVTQTGEIFGSPLYMSPEQCMGYPLDVRSDVYSLGCVMYELVTGKPPLAGENPVQTIFKHLNEMPAPLSVEFKQLNVPRGFEVLVMKALQKKPEDRYQTVEELRRDLRLVWLGQDISKSASKTKSSVPFYKSKNTLYVVATGAFIYAVVASVLLFQQMTAKNTTPTASPTVRPADVLLNPPRNVEAEAMTLAPAALHLEDHELLKTNEPARLDWRFPQREFSDLTFDLNFHDELPKGPVLFLRLYEGAIGKNHFYIGFQTNLHDPEKAHSPGHGMIYSRWGTDKLSDARIVKPGGFADANPETPFVGIRRIYPWGAHRYRIRLSQGERDDKGVWYVLSIENLDTKEVQEMGSLKFPKENGQYPLIKDRGWTMLQILRGVKYQKDVPHWRVSFEKVRIGKDLIRPQNIQVDFKQSEAADVFVKDEDKQGGTIELLMQPYAKNQHSE